MVKSAQGPKLSILAAPAIFLFFSAEYSFPLSLELSPVGQELPLLICHLKDCNNLLNPHVVEVEVVIAQLMVTTVSYSCDETNSLRKVDEDGSGSSNDAASENIFFTANTKIFLALELIFASLIFNYLEQIRFRTVFAIYHILFTFPAVGHDRRCQYCQYCAFYQSALLYTKVSTYKFSPFIMKSRYI